MVQSDPGGYHVDGRRGEEIMKINPFDVRVIDRLRELDHSWVEQLKQSISEIGLTTPICVTPDLTLIAGHHRLAACKALGMKDIPAVMLRLDDLRRELAEIDENLCRNELTVLERSEQTSRRKEIYELLHPNTTLDRRRGGGAKVDPESGPTFIDDTAAKTHRSRSTVAEDVQIAKALAPDVKDALRRTNVADRKTELLELARKPHEEQRAIVERIASGQADGVREAVRQGNNEQKRIVTLSEAVQGRFPVVYADPPWQYSNTGFAQSVENQYPTMATPDICLMPVVEKSTTNAVLFLWATNPLLEDAMRVIAAWGFEYKTNFVWTKEQHMGGFYCYGQHELLLVAVRGSALPKSRTLVGSHLKYPRGKHSAKPHELYELIERMYDGPYLEMFARNTREGWASFGNEPELAA